MCLCIVAVCVSVLRFINRNYRILFSVCVSVCVCVPVCVCVCVSVYTITQKKWLNPFELEQIVVYKNSSEEFDIGHCPFKVKVTA